MNEPGSFGAIEISNGVREDGLYCVVGFPPGHQDRYSREHSPRVAGYATLIGKKLGVGDAMLRHIAQASLLHDVGKLEIPEPVLSKADDLDDDEWELVRRHAERSVDLIRAHDVPQSVHDIVAQHHERWDGRGYPLGMRGERITLGARVIALGDAVDAMTQEQPYSPAISMRAAREELMRCRGSHFDPSVVDAFLTIPLWDLEAIRLFRFPSAA